MGCVGSSDRGKAYALKTEHDLQYKPELGVECTGFDGVTVVVAVDITPEAAAFAARLREKVAPSWKTREVLESAVVLARNALDGLGLSLEDIDRAETTYRSNDKERLSLQYESGDVRTARDRILTQPVRTARQFGTE